MNTKDTLEVLKICGISTADVVTFLRKRAADFSAAADMLDPQPKPPRLVDSGGRRHRNQNDAKLWDLLHQQTAPITIRDISALFNSATDCFHQRDWVGLKLSSWASQGVIRRTARATYAPLPPPDSPS